MARQPPRSKGSRPPKEAPPLPRELWIRRFLLGLIPWTLLSALLWSFLTPAYNIFLTTSTENLLRLTESPSVSRLQVQKRHYFVVNRTDVASPKPWLYSVRATDIHFPLILLGGLFLAVPGVPWRRRLEALGWAVGISIFFHILSAFLWVKFAYATQLGEWSAEHYGPLGQNGWGLAKHLADLPFKFGLPLALWGAFFLRELLPRGEAQS